MKFRHYHLTVWLVVFQWVAVGPQWVSVGPRWVPVGPRWVRWWGGKLDFVSKNTDAEVKNFCEVTKCIHESSLTKETNLHADCDKVSKT